MKLWVDDERQAPEGWVIADNYRFAIAALGTRDVTSISLDHDLGGTKTGYDICKYMADNNIWPHNIYIHTANPVGRDNMIQFLRRYAPAGTMMGVSWGAIMNTTELR